MLLAGSVGGVTRLPFWVHQIIEYLLAAIVALAAARSDQPAVVLGAAAVLAALAATADAPLAMRRLVRRPTHRALDWIVAALLVVVGIVLRNSLGGNGAFWMIASGTLLAFLAWRSDYSPPIPLRSRLRLDGTIDATVIADRANEASKVLGRLSGTAAAEGRRRWRQRRG